MDFAEFSGIAQILLQLLTMVWLYRIGIMYGGLSSWVTVWLAIGGTAAFMLGSRIFVLLLAHGIEHPVIVFCHRYISPLGVNLTFFTGVFLLHRLLQRLRRIRLPHPAGFVIDHENVVVDWDSGAEHLFGWTRKEALGQRFEMLVTPLRRREHHTTLAQRYADESRGSGRTARYPLQARWRDTMSEFYAEIIIAPDPTAQEPIQYQCVARRLEVQGGA